MLFLATIFGKKRSHEDDNGEEVSLERAKNPEGQTRKDMEQNLLVEKIFSSKLRAAKEKEKNLLKQAFDYIEKAAGGKELLDSAAKQGYKFIFGRGNEDDYISPSKKVVCIFPLSRTSPEKLALNCIERLVKIEQIKQLKERGIEEDHLNMADQIRLNRTQEIGIYAMKGELLSQMGERITDEDGNPRLSFASYNKKFVQNLDLAVGERTTRPHMAFLREMAISNNKNKAVESLIDSYCRKNHEYGWRRRFDESRYLEYIQDGLNYAIRNGSTENVLQKSMTPKEMVEVCFTGPFKEIVSPDFLKLKRMNRVSIPTLDRMKSISETCKAAGIIDDSYKQFLPYELYYEKKYNCSLKCTSIHSEQLPYDTVKALDEKEEQAEKAKEKETVNAYFNAIKSTKKGKKEKTGNIAPEKGKGTVNAAASEEISAPSSKITLSSPVYAETETEEIADASKVNRIQYMMQDSRIGKQSLDELNKNGYAVKYDASGMISGSVSPESKTVFLNSNATKEAGALSLIDAACFVKQEKDFAGDSPEAKAIRKADSLSAQIIFAEEMSQKNPKILETFKANGNEPVYNAFKKVMAETNNMNVARSAAIDCYLSTAGLNSKPWPSTVSRICKGFDGQRYYVESNAVAAFMAKAKQGGR